MNQRAQELGMNDTHFVNCTGLDDSEDAKEHRTSAYDIALMSRELLQKHPSIKKYMTTILRQTTKLVKKEGNKSFHCKKLTIQQVLCIVKKLKAQHFVCQRRRRNKL
jgi:D-alanyl-D-alanine carboxypeptidase